MARARFPISENADIGRRFPVSEGAKDFPTQWHIYFPNFPNLSSWGIIPKFGRIGRHGRPTFPSCRYRYLWPGVVGGWGGAFLISENAIDFATQRIIYFRNSPKFKLMGTYPIIWAHRPTWQENIPTWPENARMAAERFPISENVSPESESAI